MGALPVESKKLQYTLDWSDAAKIDWGTIILFGCGMIFGAMLGSSGLAETIGSGLNNMLGVSSALVITAMAVLLAILISETTSNTAAAVTVPIVVPLAMAAGVDPVIRRWPLPSAHPLALCFQFPRGKMPSFTAPAAFPSRV